METAAGKHHCNHCITRREGEDIKENVEIERGRHLQASFDSSPKSSNSARLATHSYLRRVDSLGCRRWLNLKGGLKATQQLVLAFIKTRADKDQNKPRPSPVTVAVSVTRLASRDRPRLGSMTSSVVPHSPLAPSPTVHAGSCRRLTLPAMYVLARHVRNKG